MQDVSQDIKEMKMELKEIKAFMKDLDADFHTLRESYIKKLQNIKKDGTISEDEFEKKLGIKF